MGGLTPFRRERGVLDDSARRRAASLEDEARRSSRSSAERACRADRASDEPREDARAVQQLKALGVSSVMLTGDKPAHGGSHFGGLALSTRS